MNSAEYIKHCIETESTGTPEGDAEYLAKVHARMTSKQGQRLIHGQIGIHTEGGELADAVKRFIRYGKAVDLVNVKEEMGDVFWYCAIIADE